MSGPLAETDSVTYGVNCSSTLNDLAHFHVANNQLPQDVMHVLLEGVLPYTMKLMLQSFIFSKKYLTLDFLNDRITCFNFSRTEAKDKPCPLIARHFQPEGKIHLEGTCNYAIFYVTIIILNCSKSDVEPLRVLASDDR